MRALVPAAVALLALLTGACGENPPADRVPPAPPTGLTNEPTPPTTQPPPTTPAKPGAEITVRGTVARGVEPNCLVLATDDREYLLLDPVPVLKPGVRAVVHGRTDPKRATTCMQGVPLLVLDARRGG